MNICIETLIKILISDIDDQRTIPDKSEEFPQIYVHTQIVVQFYFFVGKPNARECLYFAYHVLS